MEERKIIKKHTEVEREEPVDPAIKNINIGPDGSTQIQENDVVDDPIGATTVRKETTVEERRSS